MFEKHVLVVEDNAPMRQLIRSMLIQFGVRHVSLATDGQMALDKLQDTPVDAIICDWMMEPMDGLSFVKALRANSNIRIKSLPVLMLTSVANENKVIQARDTGIDEYLIKPVTANSLRTRLETIFSQRRDFIFTNGYVGPDRRRNDTQDGTRFSRRFVDRLAALGAEDDDVLDTIGVDYKDILDEELIKLQDLIKKCTESPSDLNLWRQVHRIAHDIKGQAPTFGFHAVGAVAESLERLLQFAVENPDSLLFAKKRRLKSAETHYQAIMMISIEKKMCMSTEIQSLLDRLNKTIQKVDRDVKSKNVE